MLEENTKAVATATSFCTLVDSMLTAAEQQTAGVETISTLQTEVPAEVLLQLRLQGIASTACGLALRDLQQTAATAGNPPAGAAVGDNAANSLPGALLEVARILDIPAPSQQPRRLQEQVNEHAQTRSLQTAPLVTQGSEACPRGQYFAGSNQVRHTRCLYGNDLIGHAIGRTVH